MPMKKKTTQRKRKAAPRRRQYSGQRRRTGTASQSQVFSETQKVGAECLGVNAQGEVYIPAGTQGVGVKLLTQLSTLTQVGNYRNLWSAYKILKAKFTVIPKWRGEAYNEAALGTAAGLGIIETPRFAQAINDMDQNLIAPLTELDVLQDNGCKVRMFSRPVVINVKPKPLLEQTTSATGALVNTQNKANPWIEFDGVGPNVPHIGVDGFFTAYNSLTAGFASIADIYCTVSFVCKDPR